MKLKLIATFIIALFFVGCKSSLQIPDIYQVKDVKNAGILVGSTSSNINYKSDNYSVFSSWSLYYRQIVKKDSGRIVHSNAGIPFISPEMEYKNDFVKGYTFNLKLKPGNYEIYKVTFFQNNGHFQRTYESREEFSFPFSIKKGKATYIGELISNGTFGKNIFGITIPSGGYVTYRMNEKRDLPLIIKKTKLLQKDIIINKIPIVGNTKHIIFPIK